MAQSLVAIEMVRQFEVTSSFAIPQLYIWMDVQGTKVEANIGNACDEPPVKVVYEQGYSICTVEKLPGRKGGVKVEQHC